MPINQSYTKFSSSGKVAYGTTNYVAFMEKETVHADFHPLMDFLKNSPISYALTASPTIYAEIVQEMWSTADCSSTKGGIKFTIKGKSYLITPSVINEALRFRNSNFEKVPTHGEIITMLKAVNYVGCPWMLSQIFKNKFRKEWSYFFDTLSKVFSGKCSSFDSINIFVLRIAYSLLYGRNIDIGRLLLDEFSYKFGMVENRDPVIYYARFLMIIANYLCKELSIEDRNDTVQVFMQTKRLFASLFKKDFNAEVEFELPEHVQVQLFTSLSDTSCLLVPATMEDVRECHTSPTQVALPSPYQSGTVAAASVSQSGKRKKTTLPTNTEDGNEENKSTPEVHSPQKKKDASKVEPASSFFVVDQEMTPAETEDGVSRVEITSSPEEEKPKCDNPFLLEPALEADDRQHLTNAASVLKSKLVARLTSYADRISTEDMIKYADTCYTTLEGLGVNYTSFSSEVNKLIAKHQELALAAKEKEDWNERNIKAPCIHQVPSLFEVQQKIFDTQDKLSKAQTYADSLKLVKEKLTDKLLKLTEDLHEVEEKVKSLTEERDQCKYACSVAEVEVRKSVANKEKARVASKAINDLYNAASKKFERMSNHLVQLVRK